MMTENTVSKDMAFSEFERFTTAMDLDVDIAEMDQDDVKTFKEVRDQLIKSMMRGNLVIDEKGQPVFTPSGMPEANALTFHEPTGGTLMSMDRRKVGEDISKMVIVMTEMCKTTDKVFSSMPNRDFKVCSAIVAVFLG